MIDLIQRAAPLLVQGALMALLIGIASYVLGLLIGLIVAVARMFAPQPLRALAVVFVSVMRGTPLLTQLLLVYYGLPQLGITIEGIPAAILTLSLHNGAYISEDLRGSLQAIDRGQWEAGSSIGMGVTQVLRRIIMPQAIRILIPSLGSRFMTIIKETSLASTVTVVELTRVAEQVGSSSFRYIEMFVIVAVVYWAINAVLSIGQSQLEARAKKAYQ